MFVFASFILYYNFLIVLFFFLLLFWFLGCACFQVASLYEKTHGFMDDSHFRGYVPKSWSTLARVSALFWNRFGDPGCENGHGKKHVQTREKRDSWMLDWCDGCLVAVAVKDSAAHNFLLPAIVTGITMFQPAWKLKPFSGVNIDYVYNNFWARGIKGE